VTKKKKWIAAAVIAAALAGAWYRVSRPAKTGPKFRPAVVTRGDIRVTVLATGEVQPQNRLEIKPPVSGRIESVLVKEGEVVRSGKVMAWMSSNERAALLDAARAKGPAEVAHWEDLYKPTPLVASLDGVVIARNIEPGQTVTQQDAVLVLSDRLIVKAQVDETDVGQVKAGQAAEITLDAFPDQAIHAKVDRIAYEAKTVSNVTVYEVDVLPQHAPDFFRSGMTANVTFLISEKKDVLWVPAEAVKRKDGENVVMVPSTDKKKKRPDRRAVETGMTDGKRTEVLSGLAEGDTVLVAEMGGMPSASRQGSNPFSPMGGRPGGGGGGGGRNR
jgi:macrolide-specific efflux system membrane fusion protein